ncbi:MAG TPA: PHB depolymerase family esterase [Methylomirabilota bacterium]|nr:PHB depolymerase family esterase [Methylomirabilota bacterium]
MERDLSVMSKLKKIILWALAILIGVPAVVAGTLLAWCSAADRTNGSIVSSGVTRRYLLYVPKSYDRSKAAPLVISIHPAATWAAVEENISGWNDLAEQHGFIVVYPNGSGAFFGGFSRGPHVWPGGTDLPRDVRFISDLIDKLEAEYSIDGRRIYADGMSNGGNMAFLLPCELPDRIAAVGAVAGAQPSRWDCKGSKPVATVAFHGTADKLAPYRGGPSPVAPRPFANIPEWTAHVARRNGCKEGPSETQVAPSVRRLAYGNCAEGADAILYTIEGGGHTWPGGKHLAEWVAGKTTDEISASGAMWEFFFNHPLKQQK